MAALRIFYIGTLREGSTCEARFHALSKLGCDVLALNTSPWVYDSFWIWRALGHRLNFGPLLQKLNQSIIEQAKRIGRVNVVWIDRGVWVFPETLQKLRALTGGRFVHFTLDPQLVHHRSRFFRAALPYYDLVVTTKPYEVELYTKHGARKILLVLQGYDERFMHYHPNPSDSAQWGSEVCFIGVYDHYYAHVLKHVARLGVNLRIWGPYWQRWAALHPILRPHIAGGGIFGENYLRALAHAKIALGLLRKFIPETTTTRTFEIPALGTFLLAERNEEHCNLFVEGKEAEFFSNQEELTAKIKYYLRHDQARQSIALAGRQKCLQAGYSSTAQLEKVLKILEGLS